MNQNQKNAYQALVSLFDSFNLNDLAPDILKLVKQGYTDAGLVETMLQDTQAWKTRFAGNELRRKAGLNVLSVGDYLSIENSYNSVIHQYGLPKGMFGKAAFAEWIGKDVSPSELQSRAQMAADTVNNSDQNFSNALTVFGVDKGHQIAHFLDADKALPFLQRQFQAAQIGAEALRNHLSLDPKTALALASAGITQGQAQSGYSNIAQTLPDLNKLASLSGGEFKQTDAEAATFFGNADEMRRMQQLSTAEQARFSGQAAADTRYANTRNLQGAY